MQTAKAFSGFRTDINGIRAWAVVAVLLFHFKVPGFSAGFIGVDIFFVISGFLMTGIILRGLERGNFSLWQFYMARARRIVPALMLLLAVLLALFAASLVLSVVASSWKPVGAFYLLPTRGWELAMGGLVYLLSRRSEIWLQGRQQLLYWAGLLLWLAGFVLIDTSLPWPSGWALLPVLGTALIILAQTESALLLSNPLAQWLGNISYSLYLWHWPLVVALYFAGLQQQWGWVIGGLLLSLVLGQLSYRLVENPVRLGLTQRSYWQQVAALGVAGLMIGVAAVGVRLFVFEGRLPAAVEIAVSESTNWELRSRNECAPNADATSPGCIYGNAEVGAVLLGDSHAMSSITSLEVAASEKDKGVLYLGKSGCITIEGLKRESGDCFEYNNWLLTEKITDIQASKQPVFLIGRASLYVFGHNEDQEPKPIAYFDKPLSQVAEPDFLKQFRKSYIETACNIQNTNQVFFMRPIPEMGVHVPNTVVRNIMFGRKEVDVKITLDEYHERHAFVWAAQDEAAEKCGVKILDPLPYLCDDQYCYGSRDGRPLYYDDDHLSEYGNKFLIPMFEQVFEDTGS